MLSLQGKITLLAYCIIMISFFIPLKGDRSIDKKLALSIVMLIPISISIYSINCLVKGSKWKFGLGCNVLAWINSLSVLVSAVILILINLNKNNIEGFEEEIDDIDSADSEGFEEEIDDIDSADSEGSGNDTLPEAHILGYDSKTSEAKTTIDNVNGSENGIATVSASREDGSYIAPEHSALSIFQHDLVRNYDAYNGYESFGILDTATEDNPMNVYIEWKSPQKVTHYHWRSRNKPYEWQSDNETRAPTSWEVQVKQDGTWITIHTISSEDPDPAGKAYGETYYWKIPIDDQRSATEYRWRITDTTHESNYLHISRMRIYSGNNDPDPNPEPTNIDDLSFTSNLDDTGSAGSAGSGSGSGSGSDSGRVLVVVLVVILVVVLVMVLVVVLIVVLVVVLVVLFW